MPQDSIHSLNREGSDSGSNTGSPTPLPSWTGYFSNHEGNGPGCEICAPALPRSSPKSEVLEAEVAGTDKTLRYFLTDVISRVKVDHGPRGSVQGA
jgi:hypothetical protein